MASTTVSLILNSQGNASGVRQVTQSLREQQNQIRQLQSAERARAAQARAAAAQQRALNAQVEANASKTVGAQMRASQAFESARSATARAEIAQRQHALALTRTASEANKTGSALSRIGAVAATAGSAATTAFSGLLSTLTTVAATAEKAGLALAAIGGAGLAAGLKSAANLETENILAKGNIASVLGGDRAAAGAFLARQNAAITQGAGGLLDPAISRRFANIFADDIVRAFGTDQVSAQLSAGMANQLSALTTLAGADEGQLRNVIGDFINGSLSQAMLQQRDVVGSSGLLKPLNDELAKAGKEIKDLSPGERIKVLDAALKRALTSDTLQELSGTVNGQLSILRNRLIGENGLFSVTRDLLPSVDGEQNVFEQFKKTVELLFNSNGLFAQLGRIFNASGINLDIMPAIRSGWLRFNNFLVQVNQFLLGVQNLGDLIGQLRIDQINWQQFGSDLARKVNDFLKNIDFGKLGEQFGRLLGNGLNAAQGIISGFVTNLDWGSLVTKLGNFLIRTLIGIGEARIASGKNQSAQQSGFFKTLTQTGPFDNVPQVNWTGVIAQATAAFNAFSQGFGALAQWLNATGSQVLSTISQPLQAGLQAIYSGFTSLQAMISGAIAAMSGTAASIWNSISSTVGAGFTTIQATITTVVTRIQSTVTAIWNAIQSYVTAQFTAMQSSVQGFIDGIISAVTSAWNAIYSKVQDLQSAASSLPDLGGILSSAFSSIQSALQGLLSSAQGALGGGGSNDARPVGLASSYSGTSNTLTIGELHIHAAPGENAEQLADKVIAALDARLRQRVIAFG